MDNSTIDFLSKKSCDVFGQNNTIKSIDRLLGGAQKHTYHIRTHQDFDFVLYIWDKTTTYFSEEDNLSIFISNSAELFELNNKIMTDNNINVQKLYYIDRSKKECNFEYAFVEYIDGIDMDELINNYHERIKPAFASLRKNLYNLHKIKSETPGQLNKYLSVDFDIINSSKERMNFYNLCHCLGNLSGAIELKLKNYYDMNDINSMIKFFTKELNKIAITYDKYLNKF